MKSLLVTGYSSFDLGIFREDDPRVLVIKKAIENRLLGYLAAGLEWLIFTGKLGFEFWTLEVARELQNQYPELKLSTIFSFEDTGKNWNEANQAKLAVFKSLDFVKYSFQSYENPQQLRLYNQFLVENSDAAFIFYDEENKETKLKWLLAEIKTRENYEFDLLDFESLQELADDE